MVSLLRRNCKRNQRGRYVHVIVGTGHGVLAADGCAAQCFLCVICAEQGGKRCAELLRIAVEVFKILLEGQVSGAVITACGNQTRHRFDDCARCAEERILLHEIRIKTEAHDRRSRALACGRQRCRHDLCRGQLVLAAIRHEDRACTDGAVKALGQAALEADIQCRCHIQHLFLQVCTLCRAFNARNG